MLIRQRVLLYLIWKSKGRATRLNLVKWAFLLTQEGDPFPLSTFYQFLPYQHGPFSFGLYYELDSLIQNGYIREEANQLRIVQSDFLRPGREIESILDDLLDRVGTLATSDLLSRVYGQFPWFTVNAAKSERRGMSHPNVDLAIYTVGYERLQIDGFLNMILQNGIRRLVDIRHNPISRRYGFHRSALQRLCHKLQIEYEHIPELGVASEGRRDLQTTNDYKQLFVNYRRYIQASQVPLIQKIEDWIKESPSALMCMEADSSLCHRSQLAQVISNRTGLKIIELRNDVCETPNLFEQGFLLP